MTGLPAWCFYVMLTQHVHVGTACQGPQRFISLSDKYCLSFPVVCMHIRLSGINKPTFV